MKTKVIMIMLCSFLYTEKALAQPLSPNANLAVTSAYGLSLSAVPAKASYMPQEAVQFKIQTNQDVYIYIFDAALGQKKLLWPNLTDTHYQVRANTPTFLPQYGLNLSRLNRTAHSASEKVWVVASKRKLDVSKGFPPYPTDYSVYPNANLSSQQSFIQDYLQVANQPNEFVQQEVTIPLSNVMQPSPSAATTYTTTTLIQPTVATAVPPSSVMSSESKAPFIVSTETIAHLPNTHANVAFKQDAQGINYVLATTRQQYQPNEVIEVNYGATGQGMIHLAQVNHDGQIIFLKSQYVAGQMLQEKVLAQPHIRQFSVWLANQAQMHQNTLRQIPNNAATIAVKIGF